MTGANQVLARKTGAINAVVAAMRVHVGHAGVSDNACGAIHNICVKNGAFACFINNVACRVALALVARWPVNSSNTTALSAAIQPFIDKPIPSSRLKWSLCV